MLKDRVVLLNDPEDVQAFLTRFPTSVIFKAGTCHKTMQGFGFLQERLEPREDLMCGVIRVVEARGASDLVAERTGLRHESPQVILFRDGSPVFEANNWGITQDVLADAFVKLGAEGPAVSGEQGRGADLEPYLDVLEQYLSGVIDEQQFEFTYTHMFRDDSSLRSRDEVEVLNSIFGDVDQHMNMHLMMAGRADTSRLRGRAEVAYRQLKAMQEGAPA